jgi:type I restriction enzyme S subunit
MVPNQKTTALDSFVDSRAPICYGILKPGEHVSDGIPVIKVKNIIGGKILEDDLLRTSLQIHNQYKRAEVNQGDLLLTIRGTTGRVAIVPRSLAGANITQDTARIRVSSDDDPIYVFYALQSPIVQRQIGLNTVGQAVKGINIAEVRKLKIFHPDGAVQKKIAQILSTWDKAITTTEQLLTNSQQQKKALMQQLLTGKKRLLDKNGVRFSQKFTRYHFSDLLEIDRKSLGSKTDPNFEFDYISLSDVGTGTVSDTLDRHKFNKSPSRARRIVSPEDILLATVRPNLQGFAKVKEQHKHCIASTGFAVLTPKKYTCGDYVYHYLFGSHITGQINALVVGTNYPAINSSDVSGLCIYCPQYEEQVEIAKVLNSSDELINALQRKLKALKQEKKALMQQLLTGKRRVNTAEKEIA